MPVDPKYQSMPYIIDQMRMAKKKSGYSDSTMVADLNSFSGIGWSAGYLTSLLAGRVQPTEQAADVFEKYLLARFFVSNSAA